MDGTAAAGPGPIGSAAAVLALAAVHLLASRLPLVAGARRAAWLSLAGGVSVAYVFLHLLPELAAGQRAVREALAGGPAGLLERHVYLAALAGLAVFYGLERAALGSRRRSRDSGEDGTTSPGVFRVHVASFALYNLLIGYLLMHRDEPGARSLVLYVTALGLHFLVNDFGLSEHHRAPYDRAGRWVLAGAVLAGWALGLVLRVPEAVSALLVAFLAGGIVLNVLKEELPEERASRFLAFAAGAAGYAVLLLAV